MHGMQSNPIRHTEKNYCIQKDVSIEQTAQILVGLCSDDRKESRDMRFPRIWHFDMCRFGRASAAPF